MNGCNNITLSGPIQNTTSGKKFTEAKLAHILTELTPKVVIAR